jgi:hypothetical protein
LKSKWIAPSHYPFTKGRAGLPTTVTPGGTSLVTTAPMPTTAPPAGHQRLSLAKNGPGADIGMIFNDDIAVAVNRRGKGDIIADAVTPGS